MISQEYRINRAQFPHAEIVKHGGAWIAFSDDGRRILARGETVEQLEQNIVTEGNNQNFVMEWLPGPEDDSMLGAGEWM